MRRNSAGAVRTFPNARQSPSETSEKAGSRREHGSRTSRREGRRAFRGGPVGVLEVDRGPLSSWCGTPAGGLELAPQVVPVHRCHRDRDVVQSRPDLHVGAQVRGQGSRRRPAGSRFRCRRRSGWTVQRISVILFPCSCFTDRCQRLPAGLTWSPRAFYVSSGGNFRATSTQGGQATTWPLPQSELTS